MSLTNLLKQLSKCNVNIKILSRYAGAANTNVPFRCSSYTSSHPVGDLSKYTDKFEITQSPEEWKYVEQLLGPKIVPHPKPKSEYLSGWKPQDDNAKILPYFVCRTKNHMQPVYLHRTFRGMRRITQLRRVEGDIWKLEDELRKYLEKINNRRVLTSVHEVCGHIEFKGDHVNNIKAWLDNKGL